MRNSWITFLFLWVFMSKIIPAFYSEKKIHHLVNTYWIFAILTRVVWLRLSINKSRSFCTCWYYRWGKGKHGLLMWFISSCHITTNTCEMRRGLYKEDFMARSRTDVHHIFLPTFLWFHVIWPQTNYRSTEQKR